MTGKWVPTNREGCFRYTGDLRLLLGTREQIAAAKRQIQKRSRAAKAGWDKRRTAIAIEAATADKTGTGLAVGESAGRNDIAQTGDLSHDI